MKFLKKLLKARVFIWAGVSLFLVGVLIAAHIVTSRYTGVINSALGGDRPIIDENAQGIDFPQDFETKEQAFDNGNEVTKKICEEGMILLKNKEKDGKAALPLAKGAKVSVFGKNSVKLVYGGSGSAAPGSGAKGKYGERKTIFDSLKDAGFSYNPELKKFYESSSSGSGRSANPAMENSGVPTLKTGETAYDKYTDKLKNTYDDYNDAAIVVFSRIAGENWDLPRKADDEPSRHYLELDNNERELLRQLGQYGKFKQIIVLLNGSNYIDIGFMEERTAHVDSVTNKNEYEDFGKYVDACINIGSPGAHGIMALGEILSGKVNPSGHTVDTVYTVYQNDPTWENFGGNFTSGGDSYFTKSGGGTDYYFVEYEENIYLGYRYYETRGYVENDGDAWYNANVVYPFGYGLSYTTFSEEIINKAALEAAALNANETFDVQVKVTNTGNVPGKQVVQLYVTPQYNPNGIEKPHKVLVGFAKTGLLAKDAEETVTITVDPYYFASFDNHDKNTNGFKGYELEHGNYVFHVATDAHHDIDTFTKNLADDVRFDKDPVTHNDVAPLFDDVTSGMKESLSRTDFAGTFPHRVTDTERRASDELLEQLESYESTNNEVYTVIPKMDQPYTVPFINLVGKPYTDEMWDQFLDQLTFDEMLMLFNDGCYSTAPIKRDITVTEIDEETGEEKEVTKNNYPIVPGTTSCDGPTGLVAFAGDPAVYNCCYYCSECLVAQTYNIKLAEEEGNAIGNEALIGNENGGSVAYAGWYAPGVNLHRSPFSGRNTEYYSEDPFLNGRMAATVIKKVQEKGIYANVKHFALNDQETHRSAKGIATWCDEQAIRELYLRPFEMAVKEGNSHGLMTSFNRIGTEWAGGSYRLCTTILRKEWGFVGSVICDYHTDSYMDSKQMLYAGGDLNLCGDKGVQLREDRKNGEPVKRTNAKDVTLLRQSAHNNLYAIVNSAAMKKPIKGYNLAYWKVGLYAGTAGVSAGLVIWGGLIITFLLLPKKKKQEATAEEAPATEPAPEAPAENPVE